MCLQMTYLGLRLEIHGESVMNESNCDKLQQQPTDLVPEAEWMQTRWTGANWVENFYDNKHQIHCIQYSGKL